MAAVITKMSHAEWLVSQHAFHMSMWGIKLKDLWGEATDMGGSISSVTLWSLSIGEQHDHCCQFPLVVMVKNSFCNLMWILAFLLNTIIHKQVSY